jgi:hypothetical protein
MNLSYRVFIALLITIWLAVLALAQTLLIINHVPFFWGMFWMVITFVALVVATLVAFAYIVDESMD